jgi:hypothetical protein
MWTGLKQPRIRSGVDYGCGHSDFTDSVSLDQQVFSQYIYFRYPRTNFKLICLALLKS